MEAFKNALAILAGIIGALTGLLTLYAKYLDVKKSAAREGDAAEASTTTTARAEPSPRVVRWDEPIELTPDDDRPRRESSAVTVARAREAVKAPAISLMVAGAITLFCNLAGAGFGLVDQFVTPLSEESRNRRDFLEVSRPGEFPVQGGMNGSPYGSRDDSSMVLGTFVMLCLSVPSATAIWAGYGMLRLRSYWLSVAGSIAIMAGASLCCMSGFPIGIWSLVVLFRPEVSSSFR